MHLKSTLFRSSASADHRGLFNYHRVAFSSMINLGLEIFSSRPPVYVLILTLMVDLSSVNLTLTLHTGKLLVC
jgi:hypothetical protein